MKTPEEIADEQITENYLDLQTSLDLNDADADGIRAMLIAAINADRAQRQYQGGKPQLGDEGVCKNCGTPVVYAEHMGLKDWIHREMEDDNTRYWSCNIYDRDAGFSDDVFADVDPSTSV